MSEVIGQILQKGMFWISSIAHISFSMERHAECGFNGIACGLPLVTGASTSVTQTSSVFAYSRPLPSALLHSRSQCQVSFAPVSRGTTSGSMDMEATYVYDGIWLPSGVLSQEDDYAPVFTAETTNFQCSDQTVPWVRQVLL